jgi:uncharacterized protein YchJ
MPTTTYKRTWCKKCQDWELFLVPLLDDKENLKCQNCGTPFESVKLSEIPEEKIAIQRERYKAKKKSQFLSIYNLLASGHDFNDPNTDIIESSAGQKAIDDEEKRIREEKYAKAKAEYEALLEDYQKYKGLGRNDTCACGSGKKYKKCCINKFQWMK